MGFSELPQVSKLASTKERVLRVAVALFQPNPSVPRSHGSQAWKELGSPPQPLPGSKWWKDSQGPTGDSLPPGPGHESDRAMLLSQGDLQPGSQGSLGRRKVRE